MMGGLKSETNLHWT